MLIEKHFEVAGVDYYNSRLKINSTNWSVETKHYDVHVTIDTEKNLCFITCKKPNWFCNIPGLRDSIPDVDDVLETYVETYRPFFVGPITKRVIKSWVEFKESKSVTYVSNCFILIE